MIFFFFVFSPVQGPGQKRFTVQQLVDESIGPYYANYGETRAVLMRQAKQLLADAYQADIVHFRTRFCLPAGEILKKVAENFSRNQVFMVVHRVYKDPYGKNLGDDKREREMEEKKKKKEITKCNAISNSR